MFGKTKRINDLTQLLDEKTDTIIALRKSLKERDDQLTSISEQNVESQKQSIELTSERDSLLDERDEIIYNFDDLINRYELLDSLLKQLRINVTLPARKK